MPLFAIAFAAGTMSSSTDAYGIFAGARQYWLQQRYPPSIEYDVAVEVSEGGHDRVERYASRFDAVHDDIDVDPVSDYERAHPVVPKGINASFLFLPVSKPLPPVDFIGVPKLTPTYTFGMAPFVPAVTLENQDPAALVAEIRKEFHDPDPHRPSPSPSPGGLPEITAITAFARDYDVRLAGTEPVDGHECYHLTLRATHDPKKYRIRDAWIDTHTYATWKLGEALNFADGPGTTVPWTVHFADVDGVHYISEEDADGTTSRMGLVFDRLAVRFEAIHRIERPTFSAPLFMADQFVQEP